MHYNRTPNYRYTGSHHTVRNGTQVCLNIVHKSSFCYTFTHATHHTHTQTHTVTHMYPDALAVYFHSVHLFNFCLFKMVVCHPNESLTLILSTLDCVVLLVLCAEKSLFEFMKTKRIYSAPNETHDTKSCASMLSTNHLCVVTCVYVCGWECFGNLIIISISRRKIMNAQCIFIENRFRSVLSIE